MSLFDSVSTIKGIGTQSANKLNQVGIYTQIQLLFHLPIHYQDKTKITSFSDLVSGENVLIQGQIANIEKKIFGKKQLLCSVVNARGQKILLRFFHWSEFQASLLRREQTIQCFGQALIRQSGIEMIHPQYSVISTGGQTLLEKTLTPVYPNTLGIAPARLRAWIKIVLDKLQQQQLPDVLALCYPSMPSLTKAIISLHNPSKEDVDNIVSRTHPSFRRLILDELCAKSLSLLQAKQKRAKQLGHCLAIPKKLNVQLQTQLSFKLTKAQQSSIQQIQNDLNQNNPMLRLLQGDVGCGKTIVAIFACLSGVASGFQVAIMAPTEILARQHQYNFSQLLNKLGITCILLAASQSKKEQKQTLAQIQAGTIQVVIGTHSLFQEAVVFKNLALVIIDEQHKFGVHQRLLLSQKASRAPHQLIMTATPIPRSLMMSAYADLDTSIIDELPIGRQLIKTLVLSNARKLEVYEKITQVTQAGQQVYWVCTLVDDSELLPMVSANTTLKELERHLPTLKIGLIHGKLHKQEKIEIMAKFYKKDIDVLVATTVIEVGVDTPNANLMVIENPERLGLAQLHQLRGRVGRGSTNSICLLMYQKPLTKNAKARLDILRQSNDGFLIAQKDLELRGAGEVLGVAQTGYAQFKLADIIQDRDLLALANKITSCLFKLPKESQNQLIHRWQIENKINYVHT